MIQPGSTLGHYEIVSELGRGGMGEVYRARDTKLGREVAIKVLPSEFSRDTERLARLEREARTLASLNHPNIAAIHGLEESDDGTRFLVLELVEGDTLSDRLKRGAIPVEESLKLALQIAGALEAAHEKGVIHRDLKPANIKITPDGRVKVLDFGLAKAFIGHQADANLSNSPTLSMAATQQGIILGTAAYMAPEQAKGREVDTRADVWAFGCVLYEMLTAHPVFGGDDVTTILARVVDREPDYTTLPANLHPRFVELIERCLQKDAHERFQHIGDVRLELQKVQKEPEVPAVAEAAVPVASARSPWIVAGAGVALAAIGFLLWLQQPSSEPVAVVRLTHSFPPGVTSAGPLGLGVAPDGRQIVYVTSNGLARLSLAEFEAQLIPGTEGVEQPAFSPDGEWIAYFKDGQLRKMPAGGGASILIADLESFGGFTWEQSNRILIGQTAPGRVVAVSSEGGTPETVVLPAGVSSMLRPQFLPDGETLLFSTFTPEPQVALKRPDSEEAEILFPGAGAIFVATGHIVYWFDGTLYAQPFDTRVMEPVGSPVAMVEGVQAAFSVSTNGTLVYFPGAAALQTNVNRTLVWVDREGDEEPVGAPPRPYVMPRLSPDGNRIAVALQNNVWIWDLSRRTLERLTLEGNNGDPVWNPEGTRVAFVSRRDAGNGAYWQAQDGSGVAELLTDGDFFLPSSFSPDGRQLLLGNGSQPFGIGILDLESGESRALIANEEYGEEDGRISPDGAWLAYESAESGQAEIYVRPFPEVGRERYVISTQGGADPVWSPQGRELFYWEFGSRRVMSVPVQLGQSFETRGVPEPVVEGQYLKPNRFPNYDVSADGQRFLMMKDASAANANPDDEAAAPPSPEVNIVLNWFQELRERVPVD